MVAEAPTDRLVQRMATTARGWRCGRCFYDGRIVQFRADEVTPLGEDDRCQGCSETICDRRHVLPGNLATTDPHAVQTHGPAKEPHDP